MDILGNLPPELQEDILHRHYRLYFSEHVLPHCMTAARMTWDVAGIKVDRFWPDQTQGALYVIVGARYKGCKTTLARDLVRQIGGGRAAVSIRATAPVQQLEYKQLVSASGAAAPGDVIVYEDSYVHGQPRGFLAGVPCNRIVVLRSKLSFQERFGDAAFFYSGHSRKWDFPLAIPVSLYLWDALMQTCREKGRGYFIVLHGGRVMWYQTST